MSGPWLGVAPRPLVDTQSVSRLVRLGAAIRRRLEVRMPSIVHVGDRALGVAAVVSPMLVLLTPPLVLAPMLAVAGTAVRRARRAERLRRRALTAGLPDVLDLLAVADGAGLPLVAALRAVASFAPPAYHVLLADALRRLDEGAPVTDVLTGLGYRIPASGRRSISVLGAAVRDGTPVGASLGRAAAEARRARRRAVETEVRRLPVLLLVPLITCVLPAFVLLTLVPLLLGSLEGLQLPGS